MVDTITFKTEDQAVLFDREIRGQLSDGYWGNASPMGHWNQWGRAEVAVGDNVGRNFYPRKDNYNLTNKDLLEWCGPRMINYVKLARHFGKEHVYILDSFTDLDGSFCGAPEDKGDYWDTIRDKLAQYDADEVKRVIEEDSYTMKEMRKDLREMKSAFKTISK